MISVKLDFTARGLITLYTSTLLAGMWSMIIPAVPVLAQSFGISAGTAAQTITALALGRFAGLPLSGVVLDRMGTRSAMIAGPALASAAGLLAASMPWFASILALVFVIGVAESVWVIAREVAGIDLARPDQRGRVLSGFHGVNNIGLALGPLLGGLLTETVGFRLVFITYSVGAAISVFIGFSARHSGPSHRLGRAAARPYGPASPFPKGWKPGALKDRLGGLKDLFHQIHPDLRATYVVLIFATFTSFVHRVTTQSMLPLYASSLGLPPKEVGLLFAISGFTVFAMVLPAGFIIDKVGRKWATVPSTGIPALAFLLIPFASSFFQLAVILAFLGIANGLSLGSLATSTYDVSPPSARGRLQAARRTIAEIGGVGAPLLGGFLADTFNPGVPFLAYAPLLVLSAFLLAVVGRETLR
ncbi:MAG TPA: MFS transporter [Candidatus Binatia bacterium]|nr:MFS transporter [Candidatus Binatia bacterium]